MHRTGFKSYKLSCRTRVQRDPFLTRSVINLHENVCVFSCGEQVEAGSDAPSEAKVDQRAVQPAENGLSHTPIIASKPPSLVGPPQSAGVYQQTGFHLFNYSKTVHL